jgi:hypothetical protein
VRAKTQDRDQSRCEPTGKATLEVTTQPLGFQIELDDPTVGGDIVDQSPRRAVAGTNRKLGDRHD